MEADGYVSVMFVSSSLFSATQDTFLITLKNQPFSLNAGIKMRVII